MYPLVLLMSIFLACSSLPCESFFILIPSRSKISDSRIGALLSFSKSILVSHTISLEILYIGVAVNNTILVFSAYLAINSIYFTASLWVDDSSDSLVT